VKRIVLSLALLLSPLAVTRPAGATPAAAARSHFATAQTFASCQDTWAFACGMHDAAGNTYGTAHKRQMCSRYQLRPDGSATVSEGPIADRGRYHIDGHKVVIEVLDDQGKVIAGSTLELSADGKSLGGMKRVE
jgi:hypothetical protein